MDNKNLKKLLIYQDSTIKEAMKQLNESGEKILFVINKKGQLKGTVTDGDIRRSIVNDSQLETPIFSVMANNYISISNKINDKKQLALNLMKKHNVEKIPVLNDNNEVINVISWIDFINKNNIKKSTYKNPVVIMAGGKGTRLEPFTKILPKPLIPLGNKTIIEHIMERFRSNGFNDFFVIVNYKKEMIKMYFNELSSAYNIKYIEEKQYLGTAGGLTLLKGHINDTFIVTNCDTFLEGEYKEFIKWHKERNNLLTIIGSYKEITVPYGVLKIKDGCFDSIDEKPKIDILINSGTYVFEPEALDFISEGYCDMDTLIDKVCKSNKDKIDIYPHWCGWFDIGQWDEFKKTLKYIGDKYEK